MWSQLWLHGAVIFVDQSRDHGSSANGSQAGHIPDGLHLDVRGPLLPGLVRPVASIEPTQGAARRRTPGHLPFAPPGSPGASGTPGIAGTPGVPGGRFA
jgi:hypothetical protein